MADELLRALRGAPEGLTRTDIRDLFGRNKSAAATGRALAALQERGLAWVESRPSGGRPIEVWFAGRAAPSRAGFGR